MDAQEVLTQVAWERGILDFKYHDGQIKINQDLKKSTGKLYVGNCSRQWGKSYLMVCKSIEQAIRFPKSRIKYAAAFLSDLSEFIIPNFNKVLEDCPEHIKPRYKGQGSKWVFPNGSEIKLIGVDKNPDGLRGNTIDLIILDEVGFMSRLDYLYKSIIIPAMLHRPNGKVIMISTPPESPAHEFTSFAQKAKLEGNYSEFTIYDNPMITEKMIKDLQEEYGGEETSTWKREFLCQFVVDENRAVIKNWDKKYEYDYDKGHYYTYWHKYVAMDLGIKDHTAGIFGYYNWEETKLYIEDEFTINGKDAITPNVVECIRTKEHELWKDCTIHPDGSRVYKRITDSNEPRLTLDMLTLHQLEVFPTNKDTIQAMVNKVQTWVKDGRIIVHPRCKMLTGCLSFATWYKGGDRQHSYKTFERNNTFGHYDHLAALIYLVRNIDEHTDPRPPLLGTNPQTQWINPEKFKKQNQSDAALSKLFGFK